MKKLKYRVAYLLSLLVLQEIIFRICFPIPEVSNFNRITYQVLKNDVYHDPDMFLENRTWESSLDTNYVFVHHLNEYGFRDDTWKVKKSTNKKRIIFIGDSFIEGVMADDKNTIPKQYQQLAGDNYEVFNAGMNGVGMSSYLRLINDIVPIFHPDELKLILFANDFSLKKTVFFDRVESEYSNPFTPRLMAIVNRLIDNKPLVFRWWRNSFPFLFPVPEQSNPFSTKGHLLQKEVSPKVKKAMQNASLNYYKVNLLAKETNALKQPISLQKELGIIKALCQKNNTKLTVYYLPGRNQVTDKYLKYDKESCMNLCKDQPSLTTKEYQIHAQILKKDCEQLNIQYYDLTPALIKKEKKINLHWNYDGHMNKYGYQFIASEIYLLK
ncbi:MAG: SGNH/GDSL hydrolase family protein [Flavobacteriales bacterium]|nr:SGNH/GDSL hydrolase family protein [Flavobacteriales bacterium]